MNPNDPPDENGGSEDQLNGGLEEAAPSLPSFHAAPPEITELATSCARYVLAKYGVLPDGMPDTLSLVDQYIRDARAELAVRPEGLPLLVATIGAYFGEVLRGAFECNWRVEDGQDAWRIEMEDVFLTFNPLGMAREALTLAEAEGWHAHLKMDDAEREDVERRLAALPEVEDDEYYSLATRFDVVEIAVEALRAKMLGAGLGSVFFTRNDYRDK